MADISLNFKTDLTIDLTIENNDLQTDEGLETAVLISLFTDSRPENTKINLPSGRDDLRGWWGDQFLEESTDQTGSELWLYLRGKRTNQTIKNIEDACKNALNWLIIDGIAQSVNVTTIIENQFDVLIQIEILRPNNNIENYKYFFNWQAQELKRIV